MSGPYDQQALGQVSGFSAASNTATNVGSNRKGGVQRGGDSSTSLSSNGSAKGGKGGLGGLVSNVVGQIQQHLPHHHQQNQHQQHQQHHQHHQYQQHHQQQPQFFQNGGHGISALTHSAASMGSVASGPRRPGRFHRETIRLPDQGAGHVRQVRQRLPTPEPDTIERVYLQRAGQEVIEEITEIPTTPPPRVQERTVVEPAGPPQVVKRVIRVPARSAGVSFGGNYQSGGNLLSAGSYGNVQHAGVSSGFGGAAGGYGGAATSYAGAATGFGGHSGGYGATTGAGGFGSYGGGYGGGFGGQQSFGGFGGQQSFSGFGGQQSFGGFGAQISQPVQPPVGVHPAFCFQV